MKFERSALKSHLLSTLRFDSKEEPTEWGSGPHRNLEAGFAIVRALLVLSVPLAIGTEGTNTLSSLSSRPLVGLYALYAAALIFASVTIQRKPAPILLVGIHIADILWSCAFASSMHALGPVLLLFAFPMFTATFRWGPVATLTTTLALVASLFAFGGATVTGSGINDYLVAFETSAPVVLLGFLFAHVGQRNIQLPKISSTEPAEPLISGTPAQIMESVVERASSIFEPKYIQLLIVEVATGRTFVWHAETGNDSTPIVHSEEFDQASAQPYLRLMPEGDWVLSRSGAHESLLVFQGRGMKTHKDIPAAFSNYFRKSTTVVSAVIRMSDEWQGRAIICDPSVQRTHRVALDVLRNFCDSAARSVHTAHVCLRACRATAAGERARLARELHDGVIQSLLGVDLRLERLKRQSDLLDSTQHEMQELQTILRDEALGLRQLVNDSRRRALSPERLLEYLSDLLERFQRDSGFITHFFADLDHEPMPPRVCHEIARIAEEAIINAKKHSRGSTLIVRVGCVADSWMLVVIDDGVGFDFRGAWPLEKLTSSGVGPRVILERVQVLGGELLIESTSTGARIEVSIPKNRNSCSELFLQPQRTYVRA
jgi:signal transduction histidine kinase